MKRVHAKKCLFLNQNGFFAMLLVATTSFALWSTMSTLHMYSANKSENLAKIKETADMDSLMSGFAQEVQHSFYRYYIHNKGNISLQNCPDSHPTQCILSDESSPTKPILCHRGDPNNDEDKCKICLENVHGQGADSKYCARIFGFSDQDVFGNCAKNDILCASLAINANDKLTPLN